MTKTAEQLHMLEGAVSGEEGYTNQKSGNSDGFYIMIRESRVVV
jgi:hypothetical protein